MFHTVAELFSILVGVLMLVVAWNTYTYTYNKFLLYLGIGYFWVAVLDSWHVLAFPGMPFPALSSVNNSLHFWIYSRFFESLLLLTSVLFLSKKQFNPSLFFYGFGAIVLLIIYISIAWKHPIFMDDNGLTYAKIASEYTIIAILLLAMGLFFVYQKLLSKGVYYSMQWSIGLTIVAELCFTLYSNIEAVSLFAGHVFKILSFILIYQAIVETTLKTPFRVLSQESTTYNAIPYATIVIDENGKIRQLNQVAQKMAGMDAEQLIGKNVHPLFHSENIAESECSLCLAIKENKPLSEVQVDRTHKSYLASLAKIELNSNIHAMVQSLTDITHKIRTQQQLRTLWQAIEQSPVSVVITDGDANIEYVNPAFEQITGYERKHVIGKNPRILQSGKTPVAVYQAMWKTLLGGESWKGELLNKRRDGTLFWEEVQIAPVVDEQGTVRHYLAMKVDISLRKQYEETILKQAHFDSLTGLPNRFLSLDRLNQQMVEADRDACKVAVLFLDLDNFKKVNDTLGHDVGDKLLIDVGKRLKAAVRSGDTVARFGGDEFVILLGGIKKEEEAAVVAEVLIRKMAPPFIVDKREFQVGASIGISIYPDDADSVKAMLRNADTAMYNAKGKGKNTYAYFTTEMNEKLTRHFVLEEEMRQALEREEFSVYYQPKINISNGEIMGAEALLRWNNKTLGNVSPEEFIPVAEQTGLIINIGEFVLRTALKSTAYWQKNYCEEFNIAVNLSPNQFRDVNLIDMIRHAVEQSAVSSQYLELEITEGVLMSGQSSIQDALGLITSELGISLAMDDFGTGYSSLSYLRHYPFDIVKIDQSFIRDITEDIADKELVNASIAMAHGLNLKVVAEGVETREQYEMLKTMGCDLGQGYLFSRPISFEQMTELLANGKSFP